MRQTILVGIDDTDIPGSPGTGRLTRELSGLLVSSGLIRATGITRHQLLVAPGVPYTSRNSAACLGAVLLCPQAELFDAVASFLLERAPEGADPAVCLTAPDAALAVTELGGRAQTEVLDPAEALEFAASRDVTATTLAGGPEGVVGALAAVGLRAGGNDGRFIDIPGIRELTGVLRSGDIVASTGIDAVMSDAGEMVDPDHYIDTRGWVRPALSEGRAVLFVKATPGGKGEWSTLEKPARPG